jgi:hypothetical protein
VNDENLKAGKKTQFKAGDKQGKSEAGKASGRARREKTNMRQAMQDLLDATYKQPDGSEISGTNALVMTALKQALDPESKNWAKAFDYVMKLTGMDKAPEEMKMMVARALLIQAQAETIKKIGDKADGKLLELLNGLKEPYDLHTETADADASMADESTETN